MLDGMKIKLSKTEEELKKAEAASKTGSVASSSEVKDLKAS